MRNHIGWLRLFTFFAAVCFFLSTGIDSFAALAPQASNPSTIDLDLTSSAATITANIKSPVVIQVGGTLGTNGVVTGGITQTVNPGQLVTPSFYAALQQVVHTQSQHIIINAAGSASGGYVRLTPNIVSHLSNLNVPANVSVLNIGFTNTNSL